eukprot:Nitzschia sp. Nitz4//scaffold26_size159584//24811//25401//NITZ4_002472-RA/size159584-processed-gene-0.220-mRNA-1//-1//CDS//3329545025//3138//frame0
MTRCFATDNTTPKENDSTQDYFTLLQMPPSFQLDATQLQQNYRKLMADHHPDRHAGKPMDERQALEDTASQISHAYQTLKEPHLRALHCLQEWLGVSVEASLDEDTTLVVEPAFLMTVMEWREEIDDFIDELGDDSTKDAAMKSLEALYLESKQNALALVEELDGAFAQKDVDKAKELAAKMQYWKRIQDTIQEHL